MRGFSHTVGDVAEKKEKERRKEDGIDLLLFFGHWIICLPGVIHQNKNWRKMEGLNGRGAVPFNIKATVEGN